MAKVAAETEEKARARLAEASLRVQHVDHERETALDRAAQLANLDLSLALRSHLTGAGARHLMALTDQKTELAIEVEARRADLQEAVTKVRSLERLVERLDRDAKERASRAEVAELQDLVAIRTAHERSARHHRGTAVGGTERFRVTPGIKT